ncbi:hypothetical protein ACSDR0_28275 [Streptosporangium sp. G11]|uniref:hypothetical protein n=1 Tax=Streptosporangium sp. G11 TaxID=3436926 RepID=UPI003EB6EFF2
MKPRARRSRAAPAARSGPQIPIVYAVGTGRQEGDPASRWTGSPSRLPTRSSRAASRPASTPGGHGRSGSSARSVSGSGRPPTPSSAAVMRGTSSPR